MKVRKRILKEVGYTRENLDPASVQHREVLARGPRRPEVKFVAT